MEKIDLLICAIVDEDRDLRYVSIKDDVYLANCSGLIDAVWLAYGDYGINSLSDELNDYIGNSIPKSEFPAKYYAEAKNPKVLTVYL